MILKICGITNPGRRFRAIEGRRQRLGFNFYPRSPRYIAPEDLRHHQPGGGEIGARLHAPAAGACGVRGRVRR
jgi:hypothetical protein